MNSSTSEHNAAATERKDRAVLCAKCERLNVWGSNECSRCGAHLYISCSDCGQRNERVRTRCTNCNRRLHHSIFDRVRRRVAKGTFQMNSIRVLIFCIGIAIAFGLILFFSKFELPRVL